MQIIPLTKENHKQWDDFCLESDDAWFWHTSIWINYKLHYKAVLKPESKSFIVMDNNKIAAVCPLVIETTENRKEFSFGSPYFTISPAFSNGLSSQLKNKVMKFTFDLIDKLAQENNIKRSKMRHSVLNPSFIEAPCPPFNFLLKFGYIDNSINTLIIDLRKPIKELKKDIRHGHRYDIARGDKVFQVKIFDKNNISPEDFNQYVQLHHKHHHITRPDATFKIMYDFIKQGYGFLAGAKKDNCFVSFAYFYLYKNNVYWGSSCTDPYLQGAPVGHIIQWSAIKWMHQQGYKFYEIGWQTYSTTFSDFDTEKEAAIGKFTRGFGGFTVPCFMAEKYYDKEYFLQVYQDRIKKLYEQIN